MFKEIMNHKLLTQEEEVALFKKIESAKNSNDLEIIKEGKEAKDLIVHSNMRLIASIMKNYKNRGVPTEDLIQEGVLGILKAIERFDIEKGFRFSTYATWWITQSLDRCVAVSKSVVLPVHIKDHIDRVLKAASILEKKYNRYATSEEISNFVNLTDEIIDQAVPIIEKNPTLISRCIEKDSIAYKKLNDILAAEMPDLSEIQISGVVRAYIRTIKNDAEVTHENLMAITNVDVEQVNKIIELNQIVSIDRKIGDDSEVSSISDYLQEEEGSAEESFFQSESSNLVIKCLKESNLPDRDIELIIARFGLEDGKEKTLGEISQMFDISSERARQIQTRIFSNPAFILALHKNGLINGEKVKLVLKSECIEENEAFNPSKIIEEMNKSDLSVKEKQVLISRYNLDGDGQKTLSEISKKMDLSIQRIRQIEYNALRKSGLLELVYKQNIITPSKYERIKRGMIV